MSFWRIAWRSIQQRSLASVLTALSMALGVALMVAVIVVGGSAGESFMSNAGNGYNLIVGGKGGSLQLTLNTVYRISKPLEPVPYTYYKDFLPASKRKDGQDGKYAAYVAKAVPVCLGDYYDEFRVVGTTPEYFDPLPGGREYKFADGKPYKQSDFFGAVIGSAVARKLEIGLKAKIQPTHSAEDGHVHDEKFTVRGVLAPMGNADDRSVFINLEGFYLLEGHAKPKKKTATAKSSSEPKVDEHAHEHGSEPHHHEHHEDASDGHKHEHGEDGHEHAPARADAKESSGSERPAGDHEHEEHAHEHDHAEKGSAKADEHEHDHDHAHGDENPGEAVATDDHDHDHDHAEQGKSGAAKSENLDKADHKHADGDDHAHDHEEHAHSDARAATSDEKDGHDHEHDHAHDHEERAHGKEEHAHEHAHSDEEHAHKDPAKSSHDHKSHDHSHDGHDHSHDGHDHHGHDHGHSHEPLPESAREVTAFLVRTSDIMFSQPLAQEINEGTVAQAVSPIDEITRLFSNFVGPMERVLYVLTALIIVVAAMSIMVGMYNSMNERKHEIAVMRALGASRGAVGSIVLLESILLSLVGGVLGWVLGHVLVGMLSPYVQEHTGVYLGLFRFVPKYELILIPALVALASLVGYLPAVAAYRTDVAKSLTANP